MPCHGGLPDDGEEDLPDPPLSEAEVRGLFDALPRRTVYDLRNACLLELLYGCGLRIGEAMQLDVGDIDLSRRVVVLLGSKHGQDRVVPLMGTAQGAIQDYLAVRRTLLHGPDHGALLIQQFLGHGSLDTTKIYLRLVPGRLKED